MQAGGHLYKLLFVWLLFFFCEQKKLISTYIVDFEQGQCRDLKRKHTHRVYKSIRPRRSLRTKSAGHKGREVAVLVVELEEGGGRWTRSLSGVRLCRAQTVDTHFTPRKKTPAVIVTAGPPPDSSPKKSVTVCHAQRAQRC